MIIFPKCKINIGLQIIEKRSDGYHNLESLFCDVNSPCDILEIVESDELSFSIYGRELNCAAEDNICIKAYKLLSKDFKIPPAEFHLYKNIPSGAGLGGGSSDGACTLILLNKLFELGIDKRTLASYAAILGSDCPFFIYAHLSTEGEINPMIVSGRGDILEEIDLPALAGLQIKIVTPPVFVSTAEAYGGVVPKAPLIPLRDILKLPVEQWREHLFNDFEKHIFEKHPELVLCKEELYNQGAIYASMSGSGSSIFGLFRKKAAQEQLFNTP